MRVEHEDVDRRAVAAGGERGRAGVARGGADDRHLLAPPRQRRVEQLADELQRQILEGQGRAVKQLEEPQPPVDLHQRGHRGMAKPAIGRLRHRPQLGRRERLAGEQRHDLGGKLGIGQAGKTPQRRRVERRQMVRHIEPAILGKPGEQHVLERKGAGLRPRVAGAQVAHGIGRDQHRPNLSPLHGHRNPAPHAGGAMHLTFIDCVLRCGVQPPRAAAPTRKRFVRPIGASAPAPRRPTPRPTGRTRGVPANAPVGPAA